jgi:hypothetical protein
MSRSFGKYTTYVVIYIFINVKVKLLAMSTDIYCGMWWHIDSTPIVPGSNPESHQFTCAVDCHPWTAAISVGCHIRGDSGDREIG